MNRRHFIQSLWAAAAFPYIAERYAARLPPVCDEPTPGSYYQIQPGDSPSAVARAVVPRTGHSRLGYICCASLGARWNLRLYDTRYDGPRYVDPEDS